MSDIQVAEAPAAPVAKATKKAPKDKKPKAKKTPTSTHPKYTTMIAEAIGALKERTGSSRHAIVKYIVANYKIDEKTANSRVKLALRREVQSGSLKQVKGVGASGSFRLAKADDSKPKKSPAKKAKKPAAKKPTKKTAEKKTPKKKAAKSPAKKSKTPKKSPKKPTTKKAAKPKKPVAKKAKK
ncbi:UNVERIFIED_CONTAM: hypothetical protein RMT77_014517 [Armadillidium vulgare]|nr:Histone H1.0-A [Armadillidium vulgare]